MKILRFIIIIILFVIPPCLVSQTITYKFVIADSKTNKPLEGATIKPIKVSEAKVSNNLGVAYFQKAESFSVNVSFVGYENQLLEINHSYYLKSKNDTIQISCYLLKLSAMLNTVEVVEKKGEGVLDKNRWLHDYELFNGELWLLMSGNKNNSLIVLNHLGDTIVNTQVSKKIENLEKAMGSYLFLLSKDSAFCINHSNKNVFITERFAKEYYVSKIAPLTLVNNYAILKLMNPVNASVKFKMIDLKTKNTFYLSQYLNAEKMSNNLSEISMINASNEYLESINKNRMGDLLIEELYGVRAIEHKEWDLVFHHLIELPVYLFEIKDDIYIINMDNDSIYQFDNNGNFKKSLASSFRKKNAHYSDIIVDEEHQSVYYKYVLKDNCYLEKIDLNTGKSASSNLIKETFPKKIKIKSGLVYFMFKKQTVEVNNNLYLQQIR